MTEFPLHRRRIVRLTGLSVAVGLAGCSSDGDGDGSTDGTDGGSTDGDGGTTGGGADGSTDDSDDGSTDDSDDGSTDDSDDGSTDDGDDGSTDDGDDSSTDDSGDGSTDDSDDSSTDDGDDGSTDDGDSGSSTKTVTVAPGGSTEFSPDSLEIETGDTVEFVWEGSGHNMIVESQPSDANWGGVDDLKDAGFSTSHTFDVAGEYEYYCDPHRSLGMTVTITVV